MDEAGDFTIYPFCHPFEFFNIYDKIYGEGREAKIISPPLEFLRSQHATPLSATISVSLYNLKQQIHLALQKEYNPIEQVKSKAQTVDWGEEFSGFPQIIINENDLFVSDTTNSNIQLIHLLKSAGMDILRFISQLTDMYNDKEFTNKNKSLSSLLGQERLQMQEADIMTELRHSLTHKQFPSIQCLVSAIDYLLIYLRESFWDKLHYEFKQFNTDAKNQQTQITKKIRKQVKSKTLSRRDFIIYGRNYVNDQLTDLYKLVDLIQDTKMSLYTQMVRQLCSTQFHAEHLLVFLFSKVIKQAGFMKDDDEQDYSLFIQKKLNRQRKLKITSKYIIKLFDDPPQKKPNIFKTTISPQSKRMNLILQRMQNIACVDEDIKSLLDDLKSLLQIKIENFTLNPLNKLELDDVSVEIDKYLQGVVLKSGSLLFGSNLHAFLDKQRQ